MVQHFAATSKDAEGHNTQLFDRQISPVCQGKLSAMTAMGQNLGNPKIPENEPIPLLDTHF